MRGLSDALALWQETSPAAAKQMNAPMDVKTWASIVDKVTVTFGPACEPARRVLVLDSSGFIREPRLRDGGTNINLAQVIEWLLHRLNFGKDEALRKDMAHTLAHPGTLSYDVLSGFLTLAISDVEDGFGVKEEKKEEKRERKR